MCAPTKNFEGRRFFWRTLRDTPRRDCFQNCENAATLIMCLTFAASTLHCRILLRNSDQTSAKAKTVMWPPPQYPNHFISPIKPIGCIAIPALSFMARICHAPSDASVRQDLTPQPDNFCTRPKRVLTPTVQREAWRKRPSPRHRFKRDAAYEALSARPNPAKITKDGTIDGHQTNSAAPYLGPNRYEAAITSNGFGLPERAKGCGGTQGQLKGRCSPCHVGLRPSCYEHDGVSKEGPRERLVPSQAPAPETPP